MRYARIGGQAVIEGVMMRFGDDYAVAVRKPDHTIEVKTEKYKSLVSRLHVSRIPILRGMFAFIDSMVLGMSTLTYSASFYDDEEDEGSGEAAGAENDGGKTAGTEDKSSGKTAGAESGNSKKEDKAFGFMMGLTVIISIAAAIFIFMLIPYFISNLFGKLIANSFVLTVIEGVIRIAIFLLYMIAISRMKDIQRVFMYHGAEHKTISCIESGMELTPENAAKCSRLHKRCGTSFLLIVMIVSIVCFMFITTDSRVMRLVLRLILIPVIAGISYEIIQFAGRHESKLMDALSAPGLMLQKYLTTRDPDESMLEVAIASIEAVYDWREFQRSQ